MVALISFSMCVCVCSFSHIITFIINGEIISGNCNYSWWAREEKRFISFTFSLFFPNLNLNLNIDLNFGFIFKLILIFNLWFFILISIASHSLCLSLIGFCLLHLSPFSSSNSTETFETFATPETNIPNRRSPLWLCVGHKITKSDEYVTQLSHS